MRKARKKPVEIRYMTFEETFDDIKSFNKASWQNQDRAVGTYIETLKIKTDDLIIIKTLEGDMNMTKEDVLIIGVRGECYPCKIDIFEETYEKLK
jgi:hypothetical protein